MEESHSVSTPVTHVLHLFAAASLGVSMGAMLAGGVLLVPYWQELAPADFLTWYAANGQRMFLFFAPLQLAGALLAVAAAVASARAGSSNRLLAMIAAAFAIAVFVPYFLFFQQANAGFAHRSTGADEVAAQLARYATWQWVRISLGALAFATSLLAVKRSGRRS